MRLITLIAFVLCIASRGATQRVEIPTPAKKIDLIYSMNLGYAYPYFGFSNLYFADSSHHWQMGCTWGVALETRVHNKTYVGIRAAFTAIPTRRDMEQTFYAAPCFATFTYRHYDTASFSFQAGLEFGRDLFLANRFDSAATSPRSNILNIVLGMALSRYFNAVIRWPLLAEYRIQGNNLHGSLKGIGSLSLEFRPGK